MSKKRVGVLISGGGSNMLALAKACMTKDFPAEISVVISNKADAGGLERAENLGIDALAIPSKDFSERADHEAEVSRALEAANVELVCLAGYMRIFTDSFISKWQGRMINIHPSLLPLFPGLHTHKRAIEAGCRVHGCTVHYVTLDLDAGPTICQAAVPVLTHDDPDKLAARILKVEHQIYPKALELVASGKVSMDGETKVSTSTDIDTDPDQQIIS